MKIERDQFKSKVMIFLRSVSDKLFISTYFSLVKKTYNFVSYV